jgi:hypothetical protein
MRMLRWPLGCLQCMLASASALQHCWALNASLRAACWAPTRPLPRACPTFNHPCRSRTAACRVPETEGQRLAAQGGRRWGSSPSCDHLRSVRLRRQQRMAGQRVPRLGQAKGPALALLVGLLLAAAGAAGAATAAPAEAHNVLERFPAASLRWSVPGTVGSRGSGIKP